MSNDTPTQQPGTVAAPGWYPTAPGIQGYWNGSQWTGDTAPLATTGMPMATSSTNDDRTMGMLAHLLGLFTGFIGPLVIFLMKKDESQYVRAHAAEALNFQITVMIGYLASFILMFVLIGLLLLPIIAVGALAFGIIATIAANKGEMYSYPINIRFVK
ncbi:MAG: putative Tic20 family protein [Candidatus Poriferisodalaceae bacterium]|jgi:uncharacterized Tic20 family protein